VAEPGEPRWLAEDMDLALEYIREQSLACEGCGQPSDESTDPKNARHYRAHERTCYGCAVLEWRRNALQEQEGDLAGVRLYVTRGEAS
jgi:hypothetical protein